MDSSIQLDYALFQLTPTRTRCDLVIFAGRKSEKIASGLLEPFISHLKSARDQISRGGYSIKLQPTSSDASSWFTKAILERFVRFVSTPEVLERFVTIEREINQIESSIESNEQVNGTIEVQGAASATDGDPRISVGPSKSSGDYDAEAEEKPKVRLQRVLESRKAMLKKEQAMAYARALVAGFEMNYLHDLVSFSDAFGALRLREACMKFLELCNKKSADKIWMDEVVAMQESYLRTSGVILAGEHNDLSHVPARSSASESITRHGSLDASEDNGLPVELNLQQTEGAPQLPAWANHLHQYMQNTQGPIFPQMPPYPGYIYPGMSHYPGNVLWPSNFHDSGMYLDRDIKDGKRYKSFNKKNEKIQRHSTKNEDVEIDQSSSGSDEKDHEASLSPKERIHNKKNNKHSSRKVVIRNINYIASGRNEESVSDSDSCSSDKDVDADSIKQQVEAAVGSLKRQHKSNSHRNKAGDESKKASTKLKNGLYNENAETPKDGNWDIFQNLLMKDSDSNSNDMGSKTIQVQEEYSIQKAYGEENLSSLDKLKCACDDFLLTERSTGNETDGTCVKLESRDNFHGVVKRSARDEELLMPSRVEGQYGFQNARFGTESSVIKTQKEEDWIIGSKQGMSADPGGSIDHNIFHGEQNSANHLQIGDKKRDVFSDDSFMVLSRLSYGPPQTQPRADIFIVPDTAGADQSKSSIPGDMQVNAGASKFCEPEDLSMMLGHNSAEQAVPSWTPEIDYVNDISMYESVRNKSETKPKDSSDATLLHKGNASNTRTSKELRSKVAGKEPKSKAPSGSLVRSKSDIPSRSKISTAGSTMVRGKAEKEEEKRKRMEELVILRQKRISERSGAKGVTPETSKRSSKESKKNSVSTKIEKAKLQVPSDENKKSNKPVMRSSTIDRLAAARTTNKPLATESKAGHNRKPVPKVNSAAATSSIKKTKGTQERQEKVNHSDKKTSTNNSRSSSSNIREKDSTDATPLISEVAKSAEGTQGKNDIEDYGTVKVLHTVTSIEKREISRDASEDTISIQVLSDKDLPPSEDVSMQKELQGNVDNRVGITPQITLPVENNVKTKKLSFSPDIQVMNISTPPPYSETSPEHSNSRKKWNNGESSPKIPKGFRKLLLFGRRT